MTTAQEIVDNERELLVRYLKDFHPVKSWFLAKFTDYFAERYFDEIELKDVAEIEAELEKFWEENQ